MDLPTVVFAVLLCGLACSMALYWVSYYRGGDVQVVEADWYRRFQDAFVAADLWLALAAVVAAIGLLAGQRFGLVFALLAASSLIFLALLDIAFNVRNGLYRLVRVSGAMRLEAFINAYTLALGIATICFAWSELP